MIAQQLENKTIAITGTTGFLGTALLERLLRCVPGCKMVLLIRPGRRGVAHRLSKEIFKNDCFDRLREIHGAEGFQKMCDERVVAIAADITKDGLALDEEGLAHLQGCDVFIHSAASVSFDNPLDYAISTNLIGAIKLVETLKTLDTPPHLIAVSTAYVAGTRKGQAAEELLASSSYSVPIEWRKEIAAANRARERFEDESRDVKQLEKFAKEAKNELGAAGNTALANKSEQLRTRWVRKQLVDIGIARAHSLGFSDAYAMTKAMAEQAINELRGDIPVSIVRPSIIESAWEEPFPGWIRGFRMAEPVIIGFGRGLLKDFPSSPESTVDVIPVDIVVATLIAVAANGPAESKDPQILQAASGSVNPFRMGDLYRWGTEFFQQNPIYDDHDQPIAPPHWTFPTTDKATSELHRNRFILDTAASVVRALPVRGKRAMVAANIDEQREILEKAITYVELYGKYVVCEAEYRCDNLLAMFNSLSEADRKEFNMDPRVVDWHTYAVKIHLPSVLKQGRVKTAPSGRGADRISPRQKRLRKQVLDPKRHVAAFDLENTLIQSNVVNSWGWLATRNLNRSSRIRLVSKALLEGPGLQRLDRRDRIEFLRHFYRRYEGASLKQLEEDSAELFSDLLIKNSFPEAIRRVRAHRAAGHRTVLITGALDFIVEPLRPLFDDIIAANMGTYETSSGIKLTGRMTAAPPIGESRAEVLRQYCDEHGFSMYESAAYADSTSDLALLESVGFPVAVNPDTKLAALARRRGWLVENFEPAPGGEHKTLPIAPYRSRLRRAR